MIEPLLDTAPTPMPEAWAPTLLWWDGCTGVARFDGVQVRLRQAPPVPCLHVRSINYRGGRGDVAVNGEVRVSAKASRALTRAECELVDAWLRRIAAGPRELAP